MSEVVVAFPAQSGKPRARQKTFFRKFALSNCVPVWVRKTNSGGSLIPAAMASLRRWNCKALKVSVYSQVVERDSDQIVKTRLILNRHLDPVGRHLRLNLTEAL